MRTEAAPGDDTAAPGAQVAAPARVHPEFARDNAGMYELMCRHDLLESGRPRLRETSPPLGSGRAKPLLTPVFPAVVGMAAARLLAGASSIASVTPHADERDRSPLPARR